MNYKDIKKSIQDLKFKEDKTRLDLILAHYIINNNISEIQIEVLNTINNPLTFRILNTKIWPAFISIFKNNENIEGYGYQIADLIDGYYKNHRGFTNNLLKSIDSVFKENDMENPLSDFDYKKYSEEVIKKQNAKKYNYDNNLSY